ncbi:hypothetical protein [Streptomyces deccanensis]|uniref:hypothetical protein n=1 Tax=Streptomyces deccanensis TaxID=424188 RepID=UPI001EFB4732|nr:hypothetical protein [Streptomyces deccanensis]ULR49031.1 hypothetical protein L3078_06955 [Streptomyces deccanensis]
MPGSRRRRRARTLAGVLAAGLLAVPAEADNSAIGHPVYSGSAELVPELSAGFTVRRPMRAQYDADRGAGHGTDHHCPHAPNERTPESRACPNPPPGDGC